MRSRVTIVLFAVVTLGPMLAGFVYALLYSVGLAGLLGRGFTTAHWARLLEGGEAFQSLGYTSLLVLVSLLLALVPALVLAYSLTFHRAGQGFFRVLFVPLTVPPLIAAFAMFHLLNPAGVLSRLGHATGAVGAVEDFPRLVNDPWSIGIILTHVFLVFPFFTIVFANLARKERLPELRALSQTLGARAWQFQWRVFVPVVLRRASALILLYGVFLFGTYEVPLLLGRQAPRAVTVFITEKVTRYDLMNIPVGYAMAVVYMVLIGLVVTYFLRRKSFNPLRG